MGRAVRRTLRRQWRRRRNNRTITTDYNAGYPTFVVSGWRYTRPMSSKSPTPLARLAATALDDRRKSRPVPAARPSDSDTLLDNSQDVEAGPGRLEPGQPIGRYVILECVGAGGMGVVYAAYDSDLDRRVAVKVLRDRSVRPRDQARLLREAQAMARLAHPNVVAVHEVGLVDGLPFVAMEHVEGQTLDEWCESRRKRWREVVAMMLQAARGLAAAHEQGLVHRDFKPQNVLVGDDGRARVLDFGLARAVGESTQDEILVEPSSPSSGRVARRLTETGALAGTPAYMAPEQFRGESPDARSDQFSFCVAMWEALTGERPFGGETRAELAMAVCSGELREMPRRDLPAFLRKALARGLSVEPGDRFGSMDELAAALDRDPQRTRRRVVATMAAAAGIAALSAGAARWSSAHDDPCDGARERIASAWGDERADRVEQAFSAVATDFAAASLDTVHDGLERYAQQWVAGYREACEATHVRHEQSTDLLDRRMACLGQHLQALDATTTRLAEADRDVVARSIRAVAALPAVEECACPLPMMARFAPPEDEAVAQQVEDARAQIADAHVLGLTGQATEGLRRAQATRELARTLGFAPLRAEADFAVAVLSITAGKPREAQRLLHQAVDTAIASGHDEILAEASTRLVSVIGVGLSRYEEGERWASLAAAAVQRRGDPTPDVIELGRSRCMMQADKGDTSAALPHCEQALQLSIEHYGAEHSATGLAHRALGNLHYMAGSYAEAEREYQRASELFLRSHGVDHPEYPALLNSLAATCYSLQRGEPCVELFEQTVDAATASYGADHPIVADFTNNLATVLLDAGRLDDAHVHATRALAVRRGQFGNSHPGVGAAHHVLARIGLRRGDLDVASEHAGEAVSILEATRGAEHPDVFSALKTRAAVRHERETLDDAVADWRRALAIGEALERPASALAEARFGLAKSIALHQPADVASARRLASEALADADDKTRPEIERWLSGAPAATDEPSARP